MEEIMKKFLVALMLVFLITASVFAAGQSESAEKKDTLYFVPKFTGFIFFELAGQGAQQACDELGVDMVTLGTTQDDVEGYVSVLQNLVPQKPKMLVTTSSDANAPVPVLKKLKDNGAVIVTFDSDVAKEGRDLYVNIAPYKIQAEAILKSAMYNNPDGGKVIWLAPTPNITTFNKVKEEIDSFVAKDPEFMSLEVIDTLYMNDDPEKAYSMALSAMEAHPDLAGFITSSGMANPAVNQAIQDSGRSGKVYCTGMGLPSTMETYLENGTCKQFALWSPYWFGYMAAYATIQAHNGNLEFADKTVMDIPNVGQRQMYATPDGLVTDLNMMVFFRKGNSTFETSIPME